MRLAPPPRTTAASALPLPMGSLGRSLNLSVFDFTPGSATGHGPKTERITADGQTVGTEATTETRDRVFAAVGMWAGRGRNRPLEVGSVNQSSVGDAPCQTHFNVALWVS